MNIVFSIFVYSFHGSHVCCYVAADNQVKAGQLKVMEALLEALSLHKANAEVARVVAAAMRYICVNGILSELYIIDTALVNICV